MNAKTVTEKYNAVLEGKMAKKEFVRQMRQGYPMYVSNFDGFDSTVQILKNRNMLFEASKPKKAFSGVKTYDDRPALTYSLDALERGIRAELAAMDVTMPWQGVKPEDYHKAEAKAKANLEKNPTHYLDLMSGESNNVDKHDQEKEVKRGAGDVDTFNGMKKAALKEGAEKEDEEEVELNTDADFEREQRNQLAGRLKEMSEDAKKALLGKVVGTLRTSKFKDLLSNDIIKDFIRTHSADLLDGVDVVEEFEQYIIANSDSLTEEPDEGNKYEYERLKAIKHGKDTFTVDGETDKVKGVDADDKKRAAQLKEAIKSIIKKTLVNEAATVKLADWAESYESFPGVKPVVNELENIVTEIETFYDKMSDKIANVFEKSSEFENEEGLKIGGFIAPGLESAFKQDLSKVIKKGSFFRKINLPKVRTITQADVDAHNSGERPLGETDIVEEPKSTVFTPNF